MHARDELAGVLVVRAGWSTAAVREAAAWVGEALERARLEASAGVAEAGRAAGAARGDLAALRLQLAHRDRLVRAQSDPERARELMLDFAEYTRHSLARSGDYTTVAGEFAAIEAYLALARAVLGDRLRVQVRIAPEILPVALPYLALQPLVENAVRHGVELAADGGLVQVTGEAQGSECVISVEDDGPGHGSRATPPPCWPGGATRDSVGLVNVDRRLRTRVRAGLRARRRDRRGAGHEGRAAGAAVPAGGGGA